MQSKALSLVLGVVFAVSASAAPLVIDSFTNPANPGNPPTNTLVDPPANVLSGAFPSAGGPASVLPPGAPGSASAGAPFSALNNGASSSYNGATRTVEVNRIFPNDQTLLNLPTSVGIGPAIDNTAFVANALTMSNPNSIWGNAAVTYDYTSLPANSARDWSSYYQVNFEYNTDRLVTYEFYINGILVHSLTSGDTTGATASGYVAASFLIPQQFRTLIDTFQIRMLSNVDAVDANLRFLTLSDVPEPSTYAMMAGGLGLLAFARRRRK
jgi:hypothetical protein